MSTLQPSQSLARIRGCTACRGANVRAARTGMTLLELMLVVTIMVVLATLAVPSIQRTFAQQSLRKGADRVRVAMGQARVKAIRSGQEYAVFISPGGAFFSVAPFSQYQQQVSQAARRDEIAKARRQSDIEEDLLPRGVMFVGSEVATDSRSASVLNSGNAGSSSIRPILFYPDGTSQDAKVILRNEKQGMLAVELRGLSGIAQTVRYQDNGARQ